MLRKKPSTHKLFSRERAQAIVEFAIALPFLLLLLVGIFETARMIFIYAAVNNASREAARYASAYGKGDNGLLKYKDCDSIRSWARRSAFFITLSNANIRIQYLRPTKDASGNDVVSGGVLTQTTLSYECDASSGEDADVSVQSGDRVKVTVTAPYGPMLRLIPLRPRTFTSNSVRTILGVFELDD